MTFPVGPEYFIARGVRFMGTSTGTLEDTKEALEYVRKGEVQAIVVEKKLADIPDCLAALEKGDAVGRFVVKME
jgi:alcohol dehydrogenase, propanol-preferring